MLHTLLGGALTVDVKACTCTLYAVTPSAWYALRRPAAAYVPHCVALARRMGMLARCAAALATPSGCALSYGDFVGLLTAQPLPATPLLPADARRAFNELDIVTAAPALVAQLGQLAVGGTLSADAMESSPFMAHLRALATSTDAGPPRPLLAYSPTGAPPPPVEAVPKETAAEGGHAPTAVQEKPRAKASNRAPAPAAVPRAPRTAPYPQLPLAVPAAAGVLAVDLLMLWDMVGTFSSLLRLPPVPLSRLVHAFYGAAPGESLSTGDAVAASCVFADVCSAMVHVLDAHGTRKPSMGQAIRRATRVLSAADGAQAEAGGAGDAVLAAAVRRAAWPARALAWHTRAARKAEAADVADAVLPAPGDGDDHGAEGDHVEGGPPCSPPPTSGQVASGARLSSRTAVRVLLAAQECECDPWTGLQLEQRMALGIALADALSASEPFRSHYDMLTHAATGERIAGRVTLVPTALTAAKPVVQTEELPAGGPAEGNPAEDASPALLSWEDASVFRSMLRRGQPIGRDSDGRRYFELGGTAGANCLAVAMTQAPPRADELGAEQSAMPCDAQPQDCDLMESSPSAWHLVPGHGSSAAVALLAWLEAGHAPCERDVTHFVARLAQQDQENGTAILGAGCARRFAPARPAVDGYAHVARDAARRTGSASPVSGLAATQRICAALAARCHFWNLSPGRAQQLAARMRASSAMVDGDAAPRGDGMAARGHPGTGLDSVANLVHDTASDLAASGCLGPAWKVNSAGGAASQPEADAPFSLWQARLSDSVVPGQLAMRLGELAVALQGGAMSSDAGAPLTRAAFLDQAAHHDPSLYVPQVGDTVAVARGDLAALAEHPLPGSSWALQTDWLDSCPPVMTCVVVAMAYHDAHTVVQAPPPLASGAPAARGKRAHHSTAPVPVEVPAMAWCLLDGGAAVGCFASPVVLNDADARVPGLEYIQRAAMAAASIALPWSRGQLVACLVSDDAQGDEVPQMVYEIGCVQDVRGVPGTPGWDPWEAVCVLFKPQGGEDEGQAMDAEAEDPEEGTKLWCCPWELVHVSSAGEVPPPPAAAWRNDAAMDGDADSGDGDGEDHQGEWWCSTLTGDDVLMSPQTAHGARDAHHAAHVQPHRRPPGASQAAGAARGGGRGALRGARRAVTSPHAASGPAVAAAAKAILARFNAVGDAAAAEAAFLAEYTAYWELRGEVPRTPVFVRKELELWLCFSAVTSRGGYDAVTASKQWINVAKALPGRDLTTATSASFAVRTAYERSCLALERSLIAQRLREPDPFPPGCDAFRLVLAGATAPGDPSPNAGRARVQHDDDDDDDDAGAPPRRRRRREEEDAATFDLARVAAGRRAVPRVSYTDQLGEDDGDEEYAASDEEPDGDGGSSEDEDMEEADDGAEDEEEEDEGGDDDFKAPRASRKRSQRDTTVAQRRRRVVDDDSD